MKSAHKIFEDLVDRLVDIEDLIPQYRDFLTKAIQIGADKVRFRDQNFTLPQLLEELNSYGDEYREICSLLFWYQEQGIVEGDFHFDEEILNNAKYNIYEINN